MKAVRLFLVAVFTVVLASQAMAAPKKVYLINGLFSKALGYGLTNLSKKMPYARHFKFAGGVTQRTIDGIIADAARAYENDPSTQISLVGISQGANAITEIAAALNRQGVDVYYMGVVEGGSLTPIPANVQKVDNFICTHSNCARTPVRLAAGNSRTIVQTINLDTGHIDSGNHPTMHQRVISQLN